MVKSFSQYFQNAFSEDGKTGYIRAHYDVSGYCSGNTAEGGNILNRLRNILVEAINKEITFPKAIMYVFEEDILDEMNHFKPGVSLLSGRCLEWLGNQIHRIVITHKERLPSKARKFKYPTIFWVSLPNHYDWPKSRDESRKKFNSCIRSTVSLFREMQELTFECSDWDDCDRSLLS